MGRSDIKAGSAYVELAIKDSSFHKGIAGASRLFTKFGKDMSIVGGLMAGIGTSMLAPILGAVKKFASSGDVIYRMSQRTGVSAKALSELGYAAEQSGQDIEVLENTLKKMQKTVGGAMAGKGENVKALHDIGLAVSDLRGLEPDKQFEVIADALDKIHSPTLKASRAMEIFGKSGTSLLPMMIGGAKAIRRYREEAEDLGFSKSAAQVKLAAAVTDAFKRMHKIQGSIISAIGASFAPAVLVALNHIVRVGVAVKKWVKAHSELFASIALVGAGLIGLGTAITTLGAAVAFAGIGIGGIATLMRLFGRSIDHVMAPVGLLTFVTTKLRSVASTSFRAVNSAVNVMANQVATATNLAGRGVGFLGSVFTRTARLATSAAVQIGSSMLSGTRMAGTAVLGLGQLLLRLPGQLIAGFSAARGPISAFAVGAATELRYVLSRPLAYARAISPQLTGAIGGAYSRGAALAAAAGARVSSAWAQTSAAVSARVAQVTGAVAARWDATTARITGALASKIGPSARAAFFAVAMAGGLASDKILAAFRGLTAALGPVISRIAPLVRQDLIKLATIAGVASRGIVRAFATVGPLIGNGIATSIRASLVSSARLAAVVSRGIGRSIRAGIGGVGRGVGGALGGIGMLAGMAGPMVGKFGEMLAIIPMVATSIGSIAVGLVSLVTPFALVAGAIAGGVYLWTQYSESGKAALAKVLAVLDPFIQTVKTMFGGIIDAVKAGNLPLAGSIAMMGLKVAMLQGITGLASAVGGKFGDFIGTLGTQILSGDLMGAWQTALLGISKVWSDFVNWLPSAISGAVTSVFGAFSDVVDSLGRALEAGDLSGAWDAIVDGMLGAWESFGDSIMGLSTTVSRAVVDVWEKATHKISDAILEAAGAGGWIGSVASKLLGVDVAGDLEKGKELEKKRREALAKRGIETTDNSTSLEDVKKNARDSLSARADGVRDRLDKIDADKAARRKAVEDELAQRTSVGADTANDALDKLKKDFQAARNTAGQERAKLEADDKARADEAAAASSESDPAILKKDVFATFSAAALVAGGGGSPMDKVDDKLDKANKLHARQERLLEKIFNICIENGVIL